LAEIERDFYFGKLRDIEILISINKERPPEELLKVIEKVLHAQDD
jgi:hypothetical protein